MFNGDWQDGGYDKDQPGNVGFFVFPPAEAGGIAGGHVGTADIRHRARPPRMPTARPSSSTGSPRTTRHARSMSKGGGSNPGGPADLAIPAVAAGSVTKDTLAAGRGGRQGKRGDGLHRQRDWIDLRPGLDARAPEDGRRQAGRSRPAQGRPGRVCEGARSGLLSLDGARSGATRDTGRSDPRASDVPADLPPEGGPPGRARRAGCSCSRPW